MVGAKPLVSVIIAFFNEERFLKEAVESVLSQEYSNWELILVDDGSTDSSAAMAKAYASDLKYNIVYREHEDHKNKGLSPSRNLGISLSKGSFISFLDADDLWENNKLKSQINLLLENPDASMICEASKYWYSWNKNEKKDVIKYIGTEGNYLYHPAELTMKLFPMTKGTSPCPSAITIKKSALTRIGGFEEKFTGAYGLYEDQAFLFKVYLNESVYVSNACNNWYRIREGSIVSSAQKNENQLQVRYYFLFWAREYLRKKGIDNLQIKKGLNSAIANCRYRLLRQFIKKLIRTIFP